MRKSHLTSNLSERERERERVLAEVKQKKVSRDLFIIIINLTFKTRCEVFHLCIIQEKLYQKIKIVFKNKTSNETVAGQ